MQDNKNKNAKLNLFRDFLSKPLIKKDSKALQYSGVGVQLSLTILIFLFIGIWLDRILNTEFLFTLLLTIIGFAGGFYSFYLTIRKLSDKTSKTTSDKVKKIDGN